MVGYGEKRDKKGGGGGKMKNNGKWVGVWKRERETGKGGGILLFVRGPGGRRVGGGGGGGGKDLFGSRFLGYN